MSELDYPADSPAAGTVELAVHQAKPSASATEVGEPVVKAACQPRDGHPSAASLAPAEFDITPAEVVALNADMPMPAIVPAAAPAAPAAPIPQPIPVPGRGAPPLTLSIDDVGINPELFEPNVSLPPDRELLQLFVKDTDLQRLWHEIDGLIAGVTGGRNVNQATAREILDRATSARNLVLNGRANYEQAARLVAEAKYLLASISRQNLLEHPWLILTYILTFLGLIVVGFISTDQMAALNHNRVAGEIFDTLWKTVMWGGLGGVTGALYALWRHVARKQDYRPQYAMWYYTNPLMGIILGAFIHIVVRTGILLVVGNSQTTPVEPLSYPVYFLAWAVGFQQNLAFSLADRVLEKILPEKKPEKDGEEKLIVAQR